MKLRTHAYTTMNLCLQEMLIVSNLECRQVSGEAHRKFNLQNEF